MKPYQKVDVKVKVMEVKEPVQLVEKKKQDIYVSDSFGFAKATLWEENIGKKELGKSYFLEAYVLRMYQSAKYLSGEGCLFLRTSDTVSPVGRISFSPSNPGDFSLVRNADAA